MIPPGSQAGVTTMTTKLTIKTRHYKHTTKCNQTKMQTLSKNKSTTLNNNNKSTRKIQIRRKRSRSRKRKKKKQNLLMK
jgi:hypothetical protein